jgi:hypothetical protein
VRGVPVVRGTGRVPGGCFFAQVLAEFDAPSGTLHDEIASDQGGWLELLRSLGEEACGRGELDPATDTAQLAFELQAVMELANHLSVLHRDPSQVDRGRVAVRSTIDRAAPG